MSLPFNQQLISLEEILNQVAEQMESMHGILPGIDIRTVSAWILCFLAASISSAGGVGGGSLFLPILNLVAGLEIKIAATFSAFMVTGGSLSTVIYNLFLRTSQIDYEITLLSQPCLLLGVSVGVFFNIMFPEWLITVLFAAFLACSTFKTCSAGVKYWMDETEEVRRSSRSCVDDEVSLEVATAMGGENVCATVEGTPRGKLVILVFVWVSFLGLHVILGDKDGQSFMHIKPCGFVYWLITLSQLPLAIGFTAYILYGNRGLGNEHRQDKDGKNIVGQTGNETQPKFIFPVAALLSGILGGLLGIGGGLLINPVLLQIGVPPQKTAATTCFMVLFSSSMSSAQYLILGMKGVEQALFYTLLCILGSIIGLIIIQRVVVKYGRASLIVFTVSIVMALSTISITCFGAIDVWRDYTGGKSMGFKLPC